MRTTDSIRQLYYRGLRSDCNYSCSYCPFGRKNDTADAQADERAWQRFVQTIDHRATPVGIFLIPYGEALIHRYYREGIAHLSTLPQVTGVGCQTNLSYPAERWLAELGQTGAAPDKIHVWASFHPEMTTVRRFVEQLHRLHRAGLQVCAGAVAHPDNRTLLQTLRDMLSPDIYLFINAMQGLKRKYAEEEKHFFSRLDNLFAYDLANAPADRDECLGRTTSAYVDWKGDLRACPRSKAVLGNLYTRTALDDTPCRRTCCDCYIAFSNLSSHPVRRMLGKGTLWRVPEKPVVSAIFFDIDGTLTGADGHVPERYAQALVYLSKRVPLYLATSLTEDVARRRLGHRLFRLFSGGVFADGGLLCLSGQQRECMPIPPLPDCDLEGIRITGHAVNGKIYKYSLLSPSSDDAVRTASLLAGYPYRLHHRQRLVTLTHPDACKRVGFLRLCQQLHLPTDRVLAVGNEASDREWITCTPLSCAVLSADEALRQQVRYVLNPDRLAAFFRFIP